MGTDAQEYSQLIIGMNIYNFLKAYIGPAYVGLASFCPIASLILLFVNNKIACIVALAICCIGLIAIVFGILRAINKLILDNSDKEQRGISSFYVHQSNDGRKSTFETYRLIQSKRLFLTEIPYNFKWSGTKHPVLTSNSQTIENVCYNNDKNKWDGARIKFNKPLRYNECTVVNVKTNNDDYDNTAKPWISCKLETPIDMMLFRVMLSYKPSEYKAVAIFERKRIDSEIDGEFEYLECVEFNSGNKLYSFCKTNPEPGYIYRLRWEKQYPVRTIIRYSQVFTTRFIKVAFLLYLGIRKQLLSWIYYHLYPNIYRRGLVIFQYIEFLMSIFSSFCFSYFSL